MIAAADDPELPSFHAEMNPTLVLVEETKTIERGVNVFGVTAGETLNVQETASPSAVAYLIAVADEE